MKIVCDACAAKYSIADEKVRGKVFKIRCKKCSNIIVVRGTAGGDQPEEEQPSQPEARTYGYDDAGAEGGVWHLVINQEQVGPLTEAEVRERFARGEVDLNTYTWREGFTDWSPLGTVEPFTDLQAGGGAALDGGATTQSDPGDIFAAAASGGAAADAGADLFGGAASDRGGGGVDLFGSDSGEPAAAAAASSMSAEAERKLRGERNENSVLFSLNNLAALATETPKAAPASSSGGGGASRSGGVSSTGGSEGSGLIDIRAMANIYHGDKNRAAAGGAASGSEDDLPVFGQSSFAAAAPVLLPTAAPANNNKTLYIVLGGLSAAMLLIGVVLVIFLVKGSGSKETVAANVPAAGTATDTAPAGKQPGDAPDKTADKASGDTKTAAAAESGSDKADEPEDKAGDTKVASADDKKDDGDSKSGSSSRKPASRSSGGSSSKSTKSSGSKSSGDSDSKPEPRSSGGSGCLDEVGCLLADKPPSCCSKYTDGGKKKSSGGSSSGSSSGGGDLPEAPSRSDITSAMGKVNGRVQACGSKHPAKGQVKVSVKVSPSGSVDSVGVKSTPNPALGDCVAGAVKAARFPKTQKGISFSYPYSF